MKYGWIALIVSLVAASAWTDTFRDDFEVFNDAHWEHPNRQTHLYWEVADGFLHVKEPPPPGDKWAAVDIPYLLVLTAFPGPHHQLNITVTNLRTIRSGGFGIALGKLKVIDGENRFITRCYIFLTHGTMARTLVIGERWGSAGIDRFPNPKNPNGDSRKGPRELKTMEIKFNKGHFQKFDNGILDIDFLDPDFDKTVLVGFTLMGGLVEGIRGEAWADSFTISGISMLSVEPHGKLATTWAEMKSESDVRHDGVRSHNP